ncbi:MAG: hypothetical protein P8J43_01195 [Pirellulales bacterium]|nr:hypothetical protein [Pirellulales bacterium]
MQNSRHPTADQVIPPVLKSAAEHFSMPPLPRSLQEQAVGGIFSIEIDNQIQPAQPNIVIKTIEPTRRQSDSKLLLLILLILSLIACVLGAIVFLS